MRCTPHSAGYKPTKFEFKKIQKLKNTSTCEEYKTISGKSTDPQIKKALTREDRDKNSIPQRTTLTADPSPHASSSDRWLAGKRRR
jgi:hypothetical protein